LAPLKTSSSVTVMRADCGEIGADIALEFDVQTVNGMAEDAVSLIAPGKDVTASTGISRFAGQRHANSVAFNLNRGGKACVDTRVASRQNNSEPGHHGAPRHQPKASAVIVRNQALACAASACLMPGSAPSGDSPPAPSILVSTPPSLSYTPVIETAASGVT